MSLATVTPVALGDERTLALDEEMLTEWKRNEYFQEPLEFLRIVGKRHWQKR
jgi:hypothetical protein